MFCSKTLLIQQENRNFATLYLLLLIHFFISTIAMKIIHTADLHLGNVFHQHSRVAEHRHFFQWLLQTLSTEKPDALIISGDVFDSPNPSVEVQRLFFDFLTQCTSENEDMQVVVIAGNHDSGARIEAAEELLRQHNIYVRGTVQRKEDVYDFERNILPLSPRNTSEAAVVCYALPFLRPMDYPHGMSVEEGIKYHLQQMDKWHKGSDFKKLPVVVAAHFYAVGAFVNEQEHSERLVVGGQDCVSVNDMGKRYAYTALGHIHKPQAVADIETVRYSGSPIALSFSERDYQRCVMEIELDERGRAEVRAIDYTPLCELLTLPKYGNASPEKLLSLLADLPKDDGVTPRESWPYLELHVELSQPEPELRAKIAQMLSDKAVRFCRVTTETAYRKAQDADNLPSLETQLEQISPLDLAQRCYQAQFGDEMSPALVQRFEKAEQALQES